MTSEILTILKEARQRISKEENWTQEVAALDGNNDSVYPTESDACMWCSLGTVVACQKTHKISELSFAIKELYKTIDYIGIGKYNDTHTHKEVLEMFDKTIERIKNV